MKKSAIVMLSFALAFVIITLFLFFFTSLFCINSVIAYVNPNGDPGDKIGGIFLFIIMIPYCLGMFVSAGAILPFNLILRFKMKVKTWYTLAVLIFAIVMMVVAVLYLFAFPFATSVTSSSSSSISSSQA